MQNVPGRHQVCLIAVCVALIVGSVSPILGRLQSHQPTSPRDRLNRDTVSARLGHDLFAGSFSAQHLL